MKRRKYTIEFKPEAARMMIIDGQTASEVSAPAGCKRDVHSVIVGNPYRSHLSALSRAILSYVSHSRTQLSVGSCYWARFADNRCQA
ncbi:MAG: hypothetical protein ACI9TH_003213 [Kiritimatiellia bacterium]|jgi:hypothetical protein